MSSAIVVEGLRKRYGALEAVWDVSFEVAAGEVFCLLGPNGAGKTTTTEILEGFRAPSAGQVRVLGFDPARGQRRLRERVGIVLQSCGVQSGLTVAELLEMYGRYHPRPRRAQELIELVGLESKRDVRAKALSGGQRRRLDLALALVGNPDLVFLDEPTTGFDPAARRHAWAIVGSLRELGKTVFLTTHFMDEAQFLADRVAVMRGGKIVACASPAELVGEGLHPTEIRFALPDGVSLEDLPDVPAVEVVPERELVLVRSHEGVLATQRITAWALDRGVELRRFSVAQPSLEDVYLALTDAAMPTIRRGDADHPTR